MKFYICNTCGSIIPENERIWYESVKEPFCPCCFNTAQLFEISQPLPKRCPECEIPISITEQVFNAYNVSICPTCHEHLKEVETVVVTRHPALLEYLKEKGLVDENAKCLTHATEKDIKGKNVIGILPIDMAAQANSITSVTMNLTEAHRGKELTLEDMKEIVGEIKTYKVTGI